MTNTKIYFSSLKKKKTLKNALKFSLKTNIVSFELIYIL